MRFVVRRGGEAIRAAGTMESVWWAGGLAVLTVWVATVNWPLLTRLYSVLPGNLGDPVLNVWILAWLSKAMVGTADLWHPPIFYPYDGALAFSEPLLGLVPIVQPLVWLTGDPIAAYNVAFLLLPFLTFLGVALFVRELTGRIDSGVVIGILVAASPYLAVAQITRIQALTCGWSFIALTGLHRLLKTGSIAAASVFAAGYVFQALSNTYFGIYLAIPVGGVILHALLTSDLRRNKQTLLRLAAAIATIVAVLSPVALALANARDQFGVARAEAETGTYSADLRSYVSVWHEQNPRWLVPEKTADRALFHGGLLMTLSALALIRRLRWSHPIAAYVSVAIVAFLLSLGPNPAFAGQPIGLPGPYKLLADLMPGFDALRSPGRFGIVVLMGMAAMAGFSMSVWLARVPILARVATLLVCGVVAAAQSARPFDWVAELPERSSGSRDAYAWLAQQPLGAMIELPIVADYQKHPRTAGESSTLFYQLAALDHGHRLVNGSSGFTPPFTQFLEGDASPLASIGQADVAVRLLRSIGVRYLVMHTDQYTDRASDHAAEFEEWMRSATAHVEDQRAFGATSIFLLRKAEEDPPTAGDVARVSASQMRIEATSNGAQVYRLSDRDLSQRWTAPQQTGTRVRITLNQPQLISGVTLHLRAHSIGDYPRHVRVVGRRTDGSSTLLYEGHGAFELGRQLVRSPKEPSVPLWWIPHAVIGLDLEIVSNVGSWQWSVHEIDLWSSAHGS